MTIHFHQDNALESSSWMKRSEDAWFYNTASSWETHKQK